MQNDKLKDPSNYLILAVALILIIIIGVWVIVSERFSGEKKLETKEREQYLEEASSSDKDSLEEGDPAPGFKLESIKGESISLTDLKERVFLVFLNSRCGFCQKEMKDLVELAKRGETIIGIAVGGNKKDDLIKFVQEFEINFPILIDKESKTTKNYHIKGTPTHFLINKNGVILEKYRGYAPKIELERILGE